MVKKHFESDTIDSGQWTNWLSEWLSDLFIKTMAVLAKSAVTFIHSSLVTPLI